MFTFGSLILRDLVDVPYFPEVQWSILSSAFPPQNVFTRYALILFFQSSDAVVRRGNEQKLRLCEVR